MTKQQSFCCHRRIQGKRNENNLSVIKGKTIIDFEKALKYPLGDIPLSLANADGTMVKTNKRKLAKQKTTFIVDVMALLHTMSNLPYTLEMLAWKFLSYIPKGYYRVDLVADCYFKNSMKDAERSKRSNIKEDLFSVYIHIVWRKQDKVDRADV